MVVIFLLNGFCLISLSEFASHVVLISVLKWAHRNNAYLHWHNPGKHKRRSCEFSSPWNGQRTVEFDCYIGLMLISREFRQSHTIVQSGHGDHTITICIDMPFTATPIVSLSTHRKYILDFAMLYRIVLSQKELLKTKFKKEKWSLSTLHNIV